MDDIESRTRAEQMRQMDGTSRGWLSADSLPDIGEVVVRLRDGGGINLPAKFLGRSAHQIALVTPSRVYCLDVEIDRGCIAGWMPLPPFYNEN